MSGYKEPTLADRRVAADKIKKAALDKFREKASDPALAAARAERAAAKQTRDVQKAEKKIRDAEIAAEIARSTAERTARELAEQRETELASEAARKAARDLRYAARKARKR